MDSPSIETSYIFKYKVTGIVTEGSQEPHEDGEFNQIKLHGHGECRHNMLQGLVSSDQVYILQSPTSVFSCVWRL